MNKNLTTKVFQEIEKTVRNSFVIKHSNAYQIRNIETWVKMAYYKNHRSPWFDEMSEARQWLEEQEGIRREGENMDRQDTKWPFGDNLMVEIKIIEDPQAPLHVGAGRLPDWLRNKKSLLALDTYADEICIFRCLAVHRGAHRQHNTRQTRELASSFFANHPIRGHRIHKGHFPLIESHFQQGIARYEVDEEGAFSLKYLPSTKSGCLR